MLRHFFFTSVALGLAVGCGTSDSGPTAPLTSDLLCTAGSVRCVGNATAKCAADGLSFAVSSCGPAYLCLGAGVCKESKCDPGASTCKDKSVAKQCNADGTAAAEVKCEATQSCTAGSCRPQKCTAGDKVCGWRTAATCQADGTWTETKCAQDEICAEGACAKQACAPGAVSCKDKATARTCAANAAAWVDAPCPVGQECYADYGVCLPTLTHPPADDASTLTDATGDDTAAEDTPPPPPDKGPPQELEPVDQAVCTINGQKIVFTSNKSANYVDKDKDLRVTMDKGLIKIEMSFAPIEEFDVGHWTSAEAGDVNVNILYHDGSELPPGAQFKYQSNTYDVELLKFQAAGGRVSGNFSGTFTGDGGDSSIPFENCSFDVKRHD